LADVAARARRLVPALGLSMVALSTLRRLRDRPGSRVGELAELEGVSPPGMTQLISRLADQGLVERGVDASDGRVVLVQITDSGRAVLDQARHEWVLVLAQRLSVLSEDEMAALSAAGPALQRLLSDT
jgi:DNA-binding MarR family transcriptional regulator